MQLPLFNCNCSAPFSTIPHTIALGRSPFFIGLPQKVHTSIFSHGLLSNFVLQATYFAHRDTKTHFIYYLLPSKITEMVACFACANHTVHPKHVYAYKTKISLFRKLVCQKTKNQSQFLTYLLCSINVHKSNDRKSGM